MTVQDNTPWVQVTSSGSSNEAFDFLVFGSSDLEVYIGSSAQSSGTWDIIAQTGGANAGLSPDTGGQVQFSTAPTTGNVITIFRDLARQRTTNFQPGGNINIPTLNDQLDRHTLYQAEDEFDMSRGIHMAPYDTDIASTGMELPDATTRANLTLAFTSTGAVTAVAGSTQVTVGDLGDVVLSGPADNDLIVYESTSTAWVDRPFTSSALLAVTHSTDSIVIGFDVSTGTTGQVATVTTTGVAWGNPGVSVDELVGASTSDAGQGGYLDEKVLSTTLISVTSTGTTAIVVGMDVSTGTTGQVATLTATGVAWADVASAQDAEHISLTIRNVSGGTISRGQPIFASGFHAGSTSVQADLANAASTATMPCIGLVESTEIANNSAGLIAESGLLSDMDTSTSSVDDLLYVSATGAGALTATKPTGTALIQRVGQVLRSHASAGQILIFGAGRANDTPNVLLHDLDMNSFSILSTSNLIIDGVNARIAVGSTEQIVVIAGTTVTNVVNVHSEGDATEAEFGTHRHSETANVGAVQWFSRSRGDESTELVVQADDSLAIMAAAGHDGTDYEQAARIEMLVDGTPGAGDMPGRIDLQTSSDGSAAPATRLSIRNDGEIRVTSTVGITSTTGADLLLEPGTTGQVVLDGQFWPQTMGTTGQVLAVSSTSQLDWVSGASTNFAVSLSTTFHRFITTTGMNDSGFSATCSTVSGQTVPYTAGSNERFPASVDYAIGYLWMKNATRGTVARVSAFSTAGLTMTILAGDDVTGWVTGDTLQVHGALNTFASVDLTQVIPTNAVVALGRMSIIDSNVAGNAEIQAPSQGSVSAVRLEVAVASDRASAPFVVPISSDTEGGTNIHLRVDAGGADTITEMNYDITDWFVA